MAAQYAYVMKNMTKTFPGAQKPVLSNINLQFYQGAKIGIVGPNGAGKSTLIKIMAGVDTDFTGAAWAGENITVGYLEQEPELDESKTVLENVKDGARDIADMVDRFNQIGMEMGHVSQRTAELHRSLKTEANNDAVQMGIGLVLFWPALFLLEGGDGPEASEYAMLKGKYSALHDTAVSKQCDLALLPPSPEEQIKAEAEKEQAQSQSAMPTVH